MKTKLPILTPHGHKLYWLLRERTTDDNGHHVELTLYEFLELLSNYWIHGQCLNCGFTRNVCDAGFCSACSRGAVARVP